MQFTPIVLLGPADADARSDIESFARDRGFTAVYTGDELDGVTGEVTTPLNRIIRDQTTRLALAEAGFTQVEHIARLSMVDAWRRLRRITGQALRKIVLFMDEDGRGFVDGPATEMAAAYRRANVSTQILPELPSLSQNIRTALYNGHVRYLGLLKLLSDADLLAINGISRNRLTQIRTALNEYDEQHS